MAKKHVVDVPLGLKLETVSALYALAVLKEHKGNRSHTAEALGIDRKTLKRLLGLCESASLPVPPPKSGVRGPDRAPRRPRVAKLRSTPDLGLTA